MSEARPDTWMPMYWADYWKDTAHLSRPQDSSYMRLIGHYWTQGKPLPDDDDRLARLAGCTPKEWAKDRAVLAEFFEIGDGVWRHGRIDAELSKARLRYERRANARANFKRNPESDPGGNSRRKPPPNLGPGLGVQSQSQSTIVDRAHAPDERGGASLSGSETSRKLRPITLDEAALARKLRKFCGELTCDAEVAGWRALDAPKPVLAVVGTPEEISPKPSVPVPLSPENASKGIGPCADDMPPIPDILRRQA